MTNELINNFSSYLEGEINPYNKLEIKEWFEWENTLDQDSGTT